jgi:quinol monooxygenase YgiN
VIIVMGHLTVAAEDQQGVVRDSTEAVMLARATNGCLDYAVSADPVDATRVNVAERWSDRASLDAFRGEGPDDGLGERIVAFAVEEFEVS